MPARWQGHFLLLHKRRRGSQLQQGFWVTAVVVVIIMGLFRKVWFVVVGQWGSVVLWFVVVGQLGEVKFGVGVLEKERDDFLWE